MYFHAFFTLSHGEPYKIQKLSHEFCFSSMDRQEDCDRIQFINDIERVGGVLVVGYGRWDLEPMIFTITIEEVLDMLRPIDSVEGSAVRW